MWSKRADVQVHEPEPFNAEAPLDGLSSPVTATDAFYVRNHGPVPDIDPGEWSLTVDGLVERPLRLSLSDLKRDHPSHTVTATVQCAGNRRAGLLEVRDIPGEHPWGPGAISTATWTGVRLADVLEAAGAQPEDGHVAFAALDVSDLADPPQTFGGSIDLAKARSSEVLLAWEMNGEPLPAVHGGPVRVVVPGYIGARSVKWVSRITVQDSPSDNFFQTTAYRLLPPDADPDNPASQHGIPLSSVALNCAILSPADGSHLPAGTAEVTGYAFAGDDRTVARVDISTDDGRTWTQAVVDPSASPWSWQHWRVSVELPAGEHRITARAWDSTGASQPESAEHLWNPKGYVNNSWASCTIHAG